MKNIIIALVVFFSFNVMAETSIAWRVSSNTFALALLNDTDQIMFSDQNGVEKCDLSNSHVTQGIRDTFTAFWFECTTIQKRVIIRQFKKDDRIGIRVQDLKNQVSEDEVMFTPSQIKVGN